MDTRPPRLCAAELADDNAPDTLGGERLALNLAASAVGDEKADSATSSFFFSGDGSGSTGIFLMFYQCLVVVVVDKESNHCCYCSTPTGLPCQITDFVSLTEAMMPTTMEEGGNLGDEVCDFGQQ